MIFWTGFGFLVPILGWLGAGTILAVLAILGQSTDNDGVVVPGALILGAVYTFLFHKYVLAKREVPQELENPATGEKVVVKRTNSLFFIPFRYWPYIMLAIGVIAFVYHFTK